MRPGSTRTIPPPSNLLFHMLQLGFTMTIALKDRRKVKAPRIGAVSDQRPPDCPWDCYRDIRIISEYRLSCEQIPRTDSTTSRVYPVTSRLVLILSLDMAIFSFCNLPRPPHPVLTVPPPDSRRPVVHHISPTAEKQPRLHFRPPAAKKIIGVLEKESV